MAGNTAQFDGLTIQLQHIAFDSEFTKAKLMFKCLEGFAILQQRCPQGIQMRRLCCPKKRMLYFCRAHKVTLLVEYLMFYLSALATICDIGRHVHLACVLGSYGDVLQMCLRHGHECHVAEDAVGCPVVIVVEVTAREL